VIIIKFYVTNLTLLDLLALVFLLTIYIALYFLIYIAPHTAVAFQWH